LESDTSLLLDLIYFENATLELWLYLGVVFLLLFCSAAVSGSEVSFFSLTPGDVSALKEAEGKPEKKLLALLEQPQNLLASILISNNFINISIVVLTGILMEDYVKIEVKWIAIAVNIVFITFIILLFGEIIPKVYANKRALKMSLAMSSIFHVLTKRLNPLSKYLISSSSWLQRKIKIAEHKVSVNELEHALELTYGDSNGETNDEEEKILRGIVEFGNIEVQQIMTPRTEVIALDTEFDYEEVLTIITSSGFSRMPVYKETLDNTTGFLYIKDLIGGDETKDWHQYIRPAFFVPENKSISDLLREFQVRKIHLAVVVDEYGGSSGVVSLEDVIEEIVGEIFDEFDDEDLNYSRLDDNTYVFEGKMPLVDFCRILDSDTDHIEKGKGNATTLAGYVIENIGKIPKKGERITFDNLEFTIEAADKKRIKQIKVTVK
jgi:gliding motility-associated protein GldE